MTQMTLPPWITENEKGVVIKLHVQPGASHSEFSGQFGEGKLMRLKVRIAAPPVDGAANEALIHLLKKVLRIPASRIRIFRGGTSRSKDVFCESISADEIMEKLSDFPTVSN